MMSFPFIDLHILVAYINHILAFRCNPYKTLVHSKPNVEVVKVFEYLHCDGTRECFVFSLRLTSVHRNVLKLNHFRSRPGIKAN